MGCFPMIRLIIVLLFVGASGCGADALNGKKSTPSATQCNVIFHDGVPAALASIAYLPSDGKPALPLQTDVNGLLTDVPNGPAWDAETKSGQYYFMNIEEVLRWRSWSSHPSSEDSLRKIAAQFYPRLEIQDTSKQAQTMILPKDTSRIRLNIQPECEMGGADIAIHYKFIGDQTSDHRSPYLFGVIGYPAQDQRIISIPVPFVPNYADLQVFHREIIDPPYAEIHITLDSRRSDSRANLTCFLPWKTMKITPWENELEIPIYHLATKYHELSAVYHPMDNSVWFGQCINQEIKSVGHH